MNTYRIDCGGAGDTGYDSGYVTRTGAPVNTGTDKHLFQTAREATEKSLMYILNLSNGSYDVTLGFAELSLISGTGKRVQDIYIQGKLVRSGFDAFESGGVRTAANVCCSEVNVTKGRMVIKLIKAANSSLNPAINIISVTPHKAGLVPPPGKYINAVSYSGTSVLYNDAQYWDDDFARIKAAGINTLKIWGPGNDYDYDALLTRCDQEGIRVQFTIHGAITYNPDKALEDARIVAGTIEKYKDHPCIWVWQIGSESIEPMENEGYTEYRIYKYYRTLYNAAKAADKVHPVMTGYLRTETTPQTTGPLPALTAGNFWDAAGLQDYYTMKPYSSRLNVRREVNSLYPDRAVYTTEYGESEAADDGTCIGAFSQAKNIVNMHDIDITAGDIGGCQFEWIDDNGNASVRENHFGLLYSNRTVKNPIYEALRSRYLLTPVAMPDLTVTDLVFSPRNFKPGDIVTLSATIKNNGDAAAGAEATVFSVDGSWVGWEYTPVLAAGQSCTVNRHWKATNSNQPVLKAITDYNNETVESNEDNNQLTLDYIPMKNPDIVITGSSWSPYNLVPGKPAILNATVENKGNADYNTDIMVIFAADGKYIGEAYIPGLKAGLSATVHCSWVPSAGKHELCWNLYGNKQLRESRTVLSSDLTVTSLSYTPLNPKPGDTVTLKAVVWNRGDTASGNALAGDFSTSFYIDGVEVSHQRLNALNPNGTAVCTSEWTATAGTHDFHVKVDSKNELTNEYTKNNNEYIRALPVLASDLTIDSVEYSPLYPKPGDIVTISANIRNKGIAASDQNTNVDFYCDGIWFGSSSLKQLKAGAGTSAIAAWYVSKGRHVVTAQIDGDGKVTNDINRLNNTGTLVLYNIGDGPDLVVTNAWFSKKTPVNGEVITFNVTIKNQGKCDIKGPASVTFCIDGVIAGKSILGSLAAGGQTQVNLAWTAKSGYHIMTVEVDPENIISNENEEKNNLFFRTIDIN